MKKVGRIQYIEYRQEKGISLFPIPDTLNPIP